MKAFEMQVDGDLWELFWRTIGERNPYSIHISKVKGHATDQQVAEGKVKYADKIGNDKADEVADNGRELHGKGIHMVSDIFVRRQRFYELFLKDIQNHIIEVNAIKKRLMESKEKKKKAEAALGSNKVDETKAPYRADEGDRSDDNYATLKKMKAARWFQHGKAKFDKLNEVQKFMEELEWAEVEEVRQGWTILELYVLYKKLGYPCMVEHSKNLAAARPQLSSQLEAFKKHIARMKQCMIVAEDIQKFNSKVGGARPLARLGIANSLPALRCRVKVTKETRKAIDFDLLRAKGMKQQAAKQVITEGGEVKIVKLNTDKLRRWSSSSKCFRKKEYQRPREDEGAKRSREEDQERDREGADEVSPNVPEQHFLKCPMCSTWRLREGKPLSKISLTKRRGVEQCEPQKNPWVAAAFWDGNNIRGLT